MRFEVADVKAIAYFELRRQWSVASDQWPVLVTRMQPRMFGAGRWPLSHHFCQDLLFRRGSQGQERDFGGTVQPHWKPDGS